MNKSTNWMIVCICSILSILLFILSYFGFSKIADDTIRIFFITFFSTISSILLANVLWEFIAKYSFAVQIKKLIGISTNIDQSGIETVYYNFLRIQWEEELEQAKILDVVIVYGKTWRDSNRDLFEKFIKKHRKINIFVPNPNNNEIMLEFDRRFSYTSGKTKELIFECIDYFKNIGAKVYTFDHSLQASYYRFNNACYMSFFNHKKPEKGNVPAIKASQGGEFYKYISNEIETIKSQSKEIIVCDVSDKNLHHIIREENN